MFSADDILKRHEELRSERALEEGAWRSIAEVMAPGSVDMTVEGRSGFDTSAIFDSTALYARENFVGGIFGQLMNPANRWLGLSLDDQELAAWPPIKEYLYTLTSAILSTADVGSSAFYSQAPAWIGDVGLIGNGYGYSEEVVGTDKFVDLAIPFNEAFYELDTDGKLSRFHREFMLTGRQMKRKWKNPPGSIEEEKRYKIVHAVFDNPAYRPGALGPRGKPYRAIYTSPDEKNFRLEQGYFELPYFAVRWATQSGHTYAYGPGHLSRPDVHMLNEMERSHIVGAQWGAEGAWLLPDESNLTAADIIPNALLYGALSESGKPLLQQIARAGNFQLSMEQSEQRRETIRNAFYFGIMHLINRPQMTATEFLGFQEEQLRLMAPNLAKIQTQGLAPWTVRRYRLLERAGKLPPPPPELDNQTLKIEYQSPLAKMMKIAEGRATLQIVDGVMRVTQLDPTAGDNLDGDVAARAITEAFGGVPGLIRDPRVVEEIRRRRRDSDAQQRQLDAAGQIADISATAAHAAQAQTLSDERRQ